MILRIFRVTVRAGREADFRAFVLDEALPLTRKQEGLVSVTVGLPHADTPRDFTMVSVWRDLDALIAFAGEAWREPVTLPGEEEMLEASGLHHFVAVA